MPLRRFGPAGRGWEISSAVVVVAAIVTRVHNAFEYPPLWDYDAPGHVLNAAALREGRLPPLESWSGFHPPLYHAASAALWLALPPAVPVHVGMRLLSAAAGLAAIALVWRALDRWFPRTDALVVSSFLLGVPCVAIAGGMLGNETTCALFATAVLVRLVEIPSDPSRALRHAPMTGLLGGLAALSKWTGAIIVLVAAAAYLARWGRLGRTALYSAAIVAGIAGVMVGPLIVRIGASAEDPTLAFSSGAAFSPDLAHVMARQPPGERRVGDYFTLPPAVFLAPFYEAPGMVRSVPGLLWGSFWADVHGDFLRPVSAPLLRAESVAAITGLWPTALALFGGFSLLRRRTLRFAAPLAAGALLLCLLLRYSWILPQYSAVKASYLLPATLAGAILLAAGLCNLPSRWVPAARGSLLALALGGTALTWYSWWT